MGHDRHPQLHHGTMRTFVANLDHTKCKKSGDVTLHHRATITTGTSQLHLVKGKFTVQTSFVEQVLNVCGAWLRVDGLHRLGDTDTENHSIVERLAQGESLTTRYKETEWMAGVVGSLNCAIACWTCPREGRHSWDPWDNARGPHRRR